MPLLIGVEDPPYGTIAPAQYLFAQRFVCVADGVVDTIKVECGTGGAVKVGIWDDVAGTATNRLTYNNTGTSVVSGSNDITVPDLSVTSGTYYWVGVKPDSQILSRQSSTGSYNTYYNGVVSYGDGITDPAPTLTNSNAYLFGFGGYGEYTIVGTGKLVSCIGL